MDRKDSTKAHKLSDAAMIILLFDIDSALYKELLLFINVRVGSITSLALKEKRHNKIILHTKTN